MAANGYPGWYLDAGYGPEDCEHRADPDPEGVAVVVWGDQQFRVCTVDESGRSVDTGEDEVFYAPNAKGSRAFYQESYGSFRAAAAAADRWYRAMVERHGQKNVNLEDI